jgi:hypothetical protein
VTSPHLKAVHHRGAIVTYGDWWRLDVEVPAGGQVEARFAPPHIFVASRIAAWGLRDSSIHLVDLRGLAICNRTGKAVVLHDEKKTALRLSAFTRDYFAVFVKLPPVVPGEFIAARIHNRDEVTVRVHLEVSNTDAEPLERP